MGKLVLVPTPIGNMQDISLRALETLKSADFILCEDTRTSAHLLHHFDIKKQLRPYHKFNEHKSLDKTIEDILSHELVALISDAGTPGISDPGFLLVRECISKGIEVECLPGATALIPALVNSGLPSDRFIFEGFLPVKKGRQTRLELLQNESRTMVFYESPHRLLKTLKQFAEFFGSDREIGVSRELTKLFEENFRGNIADAIQHFESKSVKGEFVIVLQGKVKEKKS